MKTNIEIRCAMGAKGLRQWELAESLGMREDALSRKLRKELPEEEKERILKVIEEIEVE